ncbi:hypothetical protein LJC39_03745 [Parabacteroides sp. OttesenSCG-928-B22]|nr:hypothetical protein [Parabacteroides sp. OttesenSCG-928-B22]
MAKKNNKWDNQHLRNTGLYTRQINSLYQSLIQEAAAIGTSVNDFNPNKPFSFADYPQTKARLDKLLKKLQSGVQTIIVNGIESEWTLSNNKNSELARQVFGNNIGKLSQSQYRKYFSTNDAAREAFISRKTAGLTISDRVWKYTDQFKDEIELGLDIGIRNGLPADKMARELKQYLQQPDKLFRRVRDEHGELQLSKHAKAYSPGAGVYRSSQKNAERLTRNETNLSYREADYERWQQFDFVVGIEIRLSHNHPVFDICDLLAGVYPKNFRFEGWHIQCFCIAVPILKTLEEMKEESRQILNGGTINTKSVNEVTEIPENFKQWVRENEGRIAISNQRGNLPMFLKYNREAWKELTSIELINEQVIGKTVRYATLLNTKSEKIGDKLGAIITPVNIKSENRILEKAIGSYDGDVARVGDIIRNTFVVEQSKITSTIEAIRREFKVDRVKLQSTNMGYTGHLLNVWVRDGVRAEIQINTPQMIYAKQKSAKSILGNDLYNAIREACKMESGLGHVYYEEYRALEILMKPTAQQIKRMKELEVLSSEYYKKIGSVRI